MVFILRAPARTHAVCGAQQEALPAVNGRGNGALLKMGAAQECVLRKSFQKNGEYLDQVLYAMLDTDWRGSRSIAAAPAVRVH